MSMDFRMSVPDAHSKAVLCVAINPLRKEICTGSEDATIRVWECESGKLVHTYQEHKGPVTALCFNKDIKMLFSGSIDGQLIVWGNNGKIMQRIDLKMPIYSMALYPRRQQIMVGHNGKVRVLQILNVEDFSVASEVVDSKNFVCAEHSDIVRCVLFSEGRFYSGGYDRKLIIYNSPNHSDMRLRALTIITEAHDAAITCMVQSKDSENSWIITGSFDRVIKLWSLEGVPWHKIDGFTDSISSMCYVAPQQALWVASASGPPIVYDPKNGVNITNFIANDNVDDKAIVRGGGRYNIKQLVYSPELNEIIGATNRKSLVQWRFNERSSISVLSGHTDAIETIAITTKEPILIFSGGADGTIRRWERLQLNPFMYSQEPLAQTKPSIFEEISEGRHYFLKTCHPDPEVRRKRQGDLHKHIQRKLVEWVSHVDIVGRDPAMGRVAPWQEKMMLSQTARESYEAQERLLTKTAEPSCVFAKKPAETGKRAKKTNGESSNKQNTLCSVFYEPLDILITSGDDGDIIVWAYSHAQEEGASRATARRSRTDDVLLGSNESLAAGTKTNHIAGLMQKAILDGHGEAVTSLSCFEYQGEHYMLSSGWDRRIIIWSLDTLTQVDIFRNADQPFGKEELAADGAVHDMDYAAELRQFGYASADKCAYIRQFDVDGTQLQLKAVLQGHEEDVTAIVWSPVHMQWVTGSEDRTVRVWSAGGIPCLKILSNEGPVSTICIDKLNGCIITGSPDRIIRVFDPVREDKELVQVHSGHTDAIRCVAHIAARGQYVSASWDQTIRTWNAYIKEGQKSYLTTVAASEGGVEVSEAEAEEQEKEVTVATTDVPQRPTDANARRKMFARRRSTKSSSTNANATSTATAASSASDSHPQKSLKMTFQIVSSLLVDDFKNNGGKYVKDDALERNLLDEDLDSTYKQLEQSLGG